MIASAATAQPRQEEGQGPKPKETARQPACQWSKLEEPGPKIVFTQEALNWTVDMKKQGLDKLQWPLQLNTSVNLENFEPYLANTLGLAANSVPKYIRHMHMFFGMFDLPEAFSLEGFMAELFDSGVAERLAALPLLSSDLPHTANIKTTLNHFVDYLLVACSRKRHMEAHRSISLFKDDVLKPIQKKTNKAMKARHTRNNRKTAQKLSNLPPAEVFQSACHKAMADLHYIEKANREAGVVVSDWKLKGAANCIMAGLVFTNSYSGRPGEWASLLRSQVQELVSKDGKFLEFEVHKTDHVYGSASRPVPPGNLKAMKKLLAIHPENATLFFQPAKTGIKMLSIGWALKKYSEVYLPGYQKVGATLSRKLLATKSRKDNVAAKVFAQFAKVDKHSEGTALESYVVETPAEEAAMGLAMFKGVVGDPALWPTKAEIKSQKEESLARLQSFFSKKSKTNMGDDEEEEELEGEEAEYFDEALDGGEEDEWVEGEKAGEEGVEGEIGEEEMVEGWERAEDCQEEGVAGDEAGVEEEAGEQEDVKGEKEAEDCQDAEGAVCEETNKKTSASEKRKLQTQQQDAEAAEKKKEKKGEPDGEGMEAGKGEGMEAGPCILSTEEQDTGKVSKKEELGGMSTGTGKQENPKASSYETTHMKTRKKSHLSSKH